MCIPCVHTHIILVCTGLLKQARAPLHCHACLARSLFLRHFRSDLTRSLLYLRDELGATWNVLRTGFRLQRCLRLFAKDEGRAEKIEGCRRQPAVTWVGRQTQILNITRRPLGFFSKHLLRPLLYVGVWMQSWNLSVSLSFKYSPSGRVCYPWLSS